MARRPSGLVARTNGDVSHELALTAITRARMCELVTAASVERRHAGSAFIVGLFVARRAARDPDAETILARLQLSEDVKGLYSRTRSTGNAPETCRGVRESEWDAAKDSLTRARSRTTCFQVSDLDALHWASEHIAA